VIKYEHLLGIPFEHGIRDCYELARDFYRDNWTIELTPHARPNDWWDQGYDLYMQFFKHEGFEIVDITPKQVRIGDGLLMPIRSSVVNHCAIYVGNGHIIHHPYGKLSEKKLVRGAINNLTTVIIRHKDVPEDQPQVNKVNLYDHILPWKRQEYDRILQQHRQ